MKTITEEIHSLINEVESRRVDSAQLERMAKAINAAMPHHKNAMGSESDHAEVALHALIAERDRLRNALSRYGRHDTACPLHGEPNQPEHPACTCGFSNTLKP